MNEIEITVSEKLVQHYEVRRKEGILASVFDPELRKLVEWSADLLITRYPELSQIEHIDTLVEELLQPKNLQAPGGSTRLLVASFVQAKAV